MLFEPGHDTTPPQLEHFDRGSCGSFMGRRVGGITTNFVNQISSAVFFPKGSQKHVFAACVPQTWPKRGELAN